VLALAIAGGAILAAGAVTRNVLLADHHTARYDFDFDFDHGSGGGFEQGSGGGVVFDQSYDVTAGERLVVKIADVDVSVASHDGSGASVRLTADEDAGSAAQVLEAIGFRVERTGEGIEITSGSDHGRHWRHDADDYDLQLEVTVPREFDVQIQTGDGDVSVDAIEGSVTLRTGDGDIALDGAAGSDVTIQTGDGDVAVGSSSSEDVRVQTGDGDIALGTLDANDVQVRTGDGDILIEDLSGALRASTGDGDVMLHIGRFDGLEVQTGDGDVTLYAPAGLAANVQMIGEEFFLGDAFELPAQPGARKLEGMLNGGGPKLSVRVGEGSIRLIER